MSLQVASGLREMHRYGITHCDIKKQNVLYETVASGKINVFITDFGVSQVKLATEKVQMRTNVKLQALSLIYAAPEVLSQLLIGNALRDDPRLEIKVDLSVDRSKRAAIKEIESSRDIYALGILMWELLHRQSAWHGLTVAQIKHKVCVE